MRLRVRILGPPEAKAGEGRLRVDTLGVGGIAAEELDRLVALGTRHVDLGQGPNVIWVVLTDPGGNEF